MLSEKRRRLHVDWLTDLGVPAPFHDSIIDAPKIWDFVIITLGSMFALSVSLLPIFGVWLGWVVLLPEYRALALATEAGASLLHLSGSYWVVPFAVGFLFLGLPLAVALEFSVITARAGRRQMAAMIGRPWLSRRPGRTVRWIFSGSVRRAAREAGTADDFLRALANDQARQWRRRAAVLALLAAALVAPLPVLATIWVAGPSGVVEQSMFSSRSYDLSRATAVTTGCYGGDRSRSYRLVYDVRFESAGARSFDLGAARPVRDDKIAAIEEIDRRLRATVVQWQRSPLDGECLTYWVRKIGSSGHDRLARLLHLTPKEMRGLQ